ncbi:hypothetical protein BJ742DRAFT_783313 [Cladochytrium replicatum]|nr:hypothetical protein BJ742DRAFT_783313 [Cladochytrium replicatum]
METPKGEVVVTDVFDFSSGNVPEASLSPGTLLESEDDGWLSLLHVDQLEELFSAAASNLGIETVPTIPQKPASLLKSRTLEMLQRWLESSSTETPCLVQTPPTPPASVTTPMFSELFSDLGSPACLDDSSVLPGTLFSSVGLEEPYSFGTALALSVEQTPAPRTPTRARETVEMACQTELTMSDFVALSNCTGSSRFSSVSRSNSPTQRSTPDNTEELSDDDDAGPDFAACKSPEEILALILKTRQNRHDQLYHCPSCDKAFSRRFNLKTHYAGTHCNVRNFSCSCCDRAFSRRYDLQRHEKLVHKLDDGVDNVSSGGPVRKSSHSKRSL